MNSELAAWIEIDPAALMDNYRDLRAHAARGSKFLASVKGNAYGHGAVLIAKALREGGVDAFVVSSLEEGQVLRAAGIEEEIVCLTGSYPVHHDAFVGVRVTPSISSILEAQALARSARERAPVYVEVDSGFHRFGVALADFEELIVNIEELPQLSLHGVYTHLPFTDATGKAWAETQLDEFDRVVQSVQRRGIAIPVVQGLSSAGVIAGVRAGTTNAVCVGHALYGLRTFPEADVGLPSLRPVLRSLRARVSYVASRSRVATLPIGLMHGFGARLAQSGSVLIGGMRAPVVRVSTANMTIDISTCGAVDIGDEVVLLGSQEGLSITLDDIARWSALTPLECVLSWSGRLPSVVRAPSTSP